MPAGSSSFFTRLAPSPRSSGVRAKTALLAAWFLIRSASTLLWNVRVL